MLSAAGIHIGEEGEEELKAWAVEDEEEGSLG
jgi:hypothetical protein